MRKIFFLLGLVVIFCLFYQKNNQYIRNDLSKPPAERQVYYQIGTIDPRFNLSEDEAKILLNEAARIWEKSLGRQSFFYDPKAAFKVNFIYDQRQKSNDARQLAERELVGVDSRNQVESTRFQQQKTSLDDEYRNQADEVNALNARVSQHQERVALVNSQGGASPSVAQALQVESDQINYDVAVLNQKGEFLNSKQANLQNQATTIQAQVDNYNQQVGSYNQNYAGRPFEVGLYKGDEINIYEFDNKDNLRLILAHEFGHALGLKHTNDPLALMYPTLEKQNLSDFKLTQSDIDLLSGRGL